MDGYIFRKVEVILTPVLAVFYRRAMMPFSQSSYRRLIYILATTVLKKPKTNVLKTSWAYCSLGWLLWYDKTIDESFTLNLFSTAEQPPEVFCKKSVLGLRPATLFKKSLWDRCFYVNFAKVLRTPFLQNTCDRLLLKLGYSKLLSASYVYVSKLRLQQFFENG